MKPLSLLACLAVAATASAADLKDPAVVADDWSKTIEQARTPMLSPGPLGPNVSDAGATILPRGATPPPPRRQLNGDVVEVPANMTDDSRMVKVVPGESPPPGAKPWVYRGEKFWIVPIAAPVEPKAGR